MFLHFLTFQTRLNFRYRFRLRFPDHHNQSATERATIFMPIRRIRIWSLSLKTATQRTMLPPDTGGISPRGRQKAASGRTCMSPLQVRAYLISVAIKMQISTK